MKTTKFSGLLLLLLAVGFTSDTQVKYVDKGVNIEVKGTSNLHDWSIKSDKGLVDATLSLGAEEKSVVISKLHFTVGSNTFKSGNNGMDKNVYKALQVTQHPNITFELISTAPVPTDGNLYPVKATGKLTIAGVNKQIDLIVNCKWSAADKALIINGTKSFKMTEYSVKPPTALFGTIKTGDAVSIEFYVKVTK